MDNKNTNEINDLVAKLDSFMGQGGGHLSGKDIAGKKDDSTQACTFTSDVNDCPACANIPNISDIDVDETTSD